MFECVINISEGRDAERLAAFDVACARSLRDRHSDAHHHRSVFTLVNMPETLVSDVRKLLAVAVATLDLREHEGVHPRLGVVDVVPFVALEEEQSPRARELRDECASWMATALGVPTYLYGRLSDGSTRTLPDIRKFAGREMRPDFATAAPFERSGVTAVGARRVLVAWNVWLAGVSLEEARHIARAVRSPSVRVLALSVGEETQISCNLIDVRATKPSEVYDHVRSLLPRCGVVQRAELVGLAPRSVLKLESADRWEQLGLSIDTTIESRLGR